ncbi:unnamed protein product [Candidula unifasciata]|uniref:Protein FAM33A n=1 Tax=Candidula unifasciata TaxID=100452 RepID=A0A8S3Z787_9EUPU|nr:unnamed protein product [Candidula unifasciata]
MEKAVDNLEALFKKADVDLNLLSRKLQMDKDTGRPLSDEDNPVKLMAQVEEAKAEFSALTREIATIQAAQKETLSYFQTSLPKMSGLLTKLEAHSGETEITHLAQAILGQVSQLMGVPDLNLPPLSELATGDQHLAVSGEGCLPREHAQASGKTCPSVGKSKQNEPACPAASAVDRRSRCSDFVEVTDQELLSVSRLVRGKVKLDDLNRTYSMLWQHFKVEGKKDALSPQQMNSMGLRVSGATGEAKLKVLRALKLCQISKNGDVKLC